MDNIKIGEQLRAMSGSEVTVKENVKYSSKKNKEYAGKSGLLKIISVGESDSDPTIVLIELTVIIKGKKGDKEGKFEIWMDGRDIVGVDG